MSSPLKIDVDDDELWHRTQEAVAATRQHRRPRVTIRCAGSCGAILGGLDATPHGPLLISWWDLDAPADEAAGVAVAAEYGRAPGRERRCVIALIGSGLAEYPALLVRCAEHGDLLVDRGEALDKLRSVRPDGHTVWAVTPKHPHLNHLPPRDLDVLDGEDRAHKTVMILTPTTSAVLPSDPTT